MKLYLPLIIALKRKLHNAGIGGWTDCVVVVDGSNVVVVGRFDVVIGRAVVVGCAVVVVVVIVAIVVEIVVVVVVGVVADGVFVLEVIEVELLSPIGSPIKHSTEYLDHVIVCF